MVQVKPKPGLLACAPFSPITGWPPNSAVGSRGVREVPDPDPPKQGDKQAQHTAFPSSLPHSEALTGLQTGLQLSQEWSGVPWGKSAPLVMPQPPITKVVMIIMTLMSQGCDRLMPAKVPQWEPRWLRTLPHGRDLPVVQHSNNQWVSLEICPPRPQGHRTH